MLHKLQKFLWKRREAKRLAEEAFRKEAMAAYSEATADDVRTLKEYDEKKKMIFEMRIYMLDPGRTGSGVSFPEDAEIYGNPYQMERRAKEVKKEIENIELIIKGRDNAIAQVAREAETLRTQAREIWHRREIFKTRF